MIHAVPLTTHALAAAAGFASAGIGAARSARSAARMPPAVAMAPAPPPRIAHGPLDRALDAVPLRAPERMIARSLIRWPVRAGVSLLGYALATSVLIASSFFGDAVDEMVDLGFDPANGQDANLTFPFDGPAIAVEDARRLPGVVLAEGHRWFAATGRLGHREKATTPHGLCGSADFARAIGTDGPLSPPPDGVLMSDSASPRRSARRAATWWRSFCRTSSPNLHGSGSPASPRRPAGSAPT